MVVEFKPYSPGSKLTCPGCRKPKRFTLYVNGETGEPFGPQYGRCDRQQACGYHLRPDGGADSKPVKFIAEPPKPVDYLSIKDVEAREAATGRNDFFDFLYDTIGADKLNEAKAAYRLGTSLKHTGFISLPQIDLEGRVRRIKEMGYCPKTGKRLKDGNSQRWAFESWEYPDLNLRQCYAGLHLAKGNDKPVAIVESEKTAIIANALVGYYVWVASGSLGMLSNKRCKPLRGRDVVLFPDLGCYDDWAKKARYIKGMRSLTVSDYLERNKEKFNLKDGDDLADILLTLNTNK